MLRQIDPPPAEDVSRHCGNCGYDLRAATTARCPECGVAFDPAGPAVADVPWLHRATIGDAAALWRTVWLVTAQTPRFAYEVGRDTAVDVDAARMFRRVCVRVAACSMAPAAAIQLAPHAWAMVMTSAALILPLLLFFHLATMMIDTGRDESPARTWRVMTLHDFTAAPLLFMPLVTVLAVLSKLLAEPFIRAAVTPTAALVVVLWVYTTFAYHHYADGGGLNRVLIRLILTVVAWGTFGGICFMLILLAIAFTDRLFDW